MCDARVDDPEDEQRIDELLAMSPVLLQPEAIELRDEVRRLRTQVKRLTTERDLAESDGNCARRDLTGAYTILTGAVPGHPASATAAAEKTARLIRDHNAERERIVSTHRRRAGFEVGTGSFHDDRLQFEPANRYRCQRCGAIGGTDATRPTLAELDGMADRHRCLPPYESLQDTT